jgi:YVTN family beta-propeller protein
MTAAALTAQCCQPPEPGTVSVISTANNTVVATIPVGVDAAGVAVGRANTPSAGNVYATSINDAGGTGVGQVSVIHTA